MGCAVHCDDAGYCAGDVDEVKVGSRLARAAALEARMLGSLRTLQSLELAGTAVTDAVMPHICGLTALTRLDLRDCWRLSAAGVAAVDALHTLEHFAVSFVKMHGACDALAPLRALTFLLVVSCGLRDEDVEAAVRELRRLRVLRLDNSDVRLAPAGMHGYHNQFTAGVGVTLGRACLNVRVLGIVLDSGVDGGQVTGHVAWLMQCTSIREVTVRFACERDCGDGAVEAVGDAGLCEALVLKYGEAFQASKCTHAPVCFWCLTDRV